MAYPRRQHAASPGPGASSDEDSPSLRPPRPFFVVGNRSGSSEDVTSVDPPSDSDREDIELSNRVPPRSTIHDRRLSREFPRQSHRPPPSAFPFLAHPGNPDPLPRPRRRSSLDSGTMQTSEPVHQSFPRTGSLTDLRKPVAPFMATDSAMLPRSLSSSSLYRGSAAGALDAPAIPRNSSAHSFRAPFLAPSSRPNSSLWSPPSYSNQLTTSNPSPTPNASTTALGTFPIPNLKSKPPLPSTRLSAPVPKSEKPWLEKPQPGSRMSYFLTLCMLLLGLGAAGALCWRGYASVRLLPDSQLCLVMSEDFSSSSLDDSIWSYDVQLGGFGNGEFEMTTDSSDNLFLQDGQLYIHPTLTSDKVSNILDGGNYTLSGCTTSNKTACVAASSAARGAVINPVQSARINTKGKKSIKYGKVEFSAKLPRGDWLWPAVWMLPEDNVYGAWPISGEIDILEARGNNPSYPAQGSNYVRSSLNYGPMPALFSQIYGWFSEKRSSYASSFHTYTLEWTPSFIRVSVDSRLHAMLDIPTTGKKQSFWDRGNFPVTARNGTGGAEVVVQNPYGDSKAAPFDQSFYLIISLAAGGTSGWFPDNVGSKPWFDGSLSAMRDFAKAQDTWYSTWPQGSQEGDRSLRVDWVRMWEMC